MADRSLIEANRRMLEAGRRPEYKSQLPSGNNLFDTVKQVNTDRKNKIKAINDSVSNSMGKMKSNLDLTAYSREEQKNIGKFLTNQRSIYANSANELAKISDTSSPEYQYHVDVMNNVNNSFVNLKNQLDSYKENKIEFAEGVRTGLFSEGNDETQYNTAAAMYGLTGDEKTNAPFQIAENGNLGFNINNEFVSYNDFEQPFAKDYKVASTILKQTADLYKNHTLLQGPQKNLLRLNLEASLTDPRTVKSLVSAFESQGLNFSDIPLDDMDAAKGMIVDRIMNSYTEVAAQGKAEYDAKRADKNPSNPSNTNTFNKNQTLALGYFDNKAGSIPLTGGLQARAVDAEGNFIIDSNTGLPREGAEVAGYEIGNFEKGNWVSSPGSEPISINDDPAEFIRKAGIK